MVALQTYKYRKEASLNPAQLVPSVLPRTESTLTDPDVYHPLLGSAAAINSRPDRSKKGGKTRGANWVPVLPS